MPKLQLDGGSETISFLNARMSGDIKPLKSRILGHCFFLGVLDETHIEFCFSLRHQGEY